MTDLSTAIGPLRLKNPVMAASSEATMTEEGIRACLDAGAGAVVAKSVNESPAGRRQLLIADYALLGPAGETVDWQRSSGDETLLCRSGLAPLDGWLTMLERTSRYARGLGSHVIGSITVAEPEPAARIARDMAPVVSAVELNIGAPHGREATAVRQITGAEMVKHYTRTVRAGLDVPLVVKLPAQAESPLELAAAARDAGADAVSMIGRFNGFWPDPVTSEPVLGSWGAVGGPGMLPVSLYWVSKTYAADRELPLIGTNGARNGMDVARFLLSGARAVELASAVLMRGPGVLSDCVRDLDTALTEGGYARATDAVGAAVRRARSYADIPLGDEPPRPWENGRTAR
ncbi:dihydroorotate dehydrogenase [Streptomyces halstedii]|uniref:Dihydroorotate dehydrogenase n=1 Tax=Streptomyces halstedii TaxID=1944 RepID=A0A6N9TZ37_STRHA|nr:dihydroorotate dehydrogenase [Streptomyces halstedii]NEA16794.1 dihydroorotate dehydrogenase [Streptomyces halstedii]